jgi:hypothetical protein
MKIMKKSIVLAILALAGGTTASNGVGTIYFENYFSPTSPTINYSSDPILVPPGKAGLALGSEFSVELAYYPGVTSNPFDLTLLPASITAFGFDPVAYPAADGQLSYGAGWFLGSTLELPGTTQGEVVTLDVYAFNNRNLAASTLNGSSGLFQVTLGGGIYPAALLTPMPNFTGPVPEPATLAMGGLGLAALTLLRRKQA